MKRNSCTGALQLTLDCVAYLFRKTVNDFRDGAEKPPTNHERKDHSDDR